MKPTLRILAIPVLVAVLAACGSDQQVSVDDGDAAPVEVAAAPAQDDGETTTTEAPEEKTTPLAELLPTGQSAPVLGGPLKMNGTVYDDSVYARNCTGDTVVMFDVNRGYSKLTTTVGVDDNSPADDQVDVTFIADGNTVSTTSARLGEPSPVEISLDNVLRLQVEFRGGRAGCDLTTGFATYIGLGNAQLTAKG